MLIVEPMEQALQANASRNSSVKTARTASARKTRQTAKNSHLLQPLNASRLPLLLLCVLLAALPNASAKSTVPSVADFPFLQAELHNPAGSFTPAFAEGRFLVRQNPWSKFDPLGLYEYQPGDPVMSAPRPPAAIPPLSIHITDAFANTGLMVFGGPGAVTVSSPFARANGYEQFARQNEALFVQGQGAALDAAGAWSFARAGSISPTVQPSYVNPPVSSVSRTSILTNSAKTGIEPCKSAQATLAEAQAEVAKTYHRLGDSPETVAKIKESCELWGQSPKNIFGSDIPKAKAYEGPLPEGASGFEFKSSVPPDVGSVPGKPTWSGQRPGVVTENGWAKVKAEVTKDTVTPKQSDVGK